MYASYIGHDTIVHLLLEAGVNVNIPTPEGQTPLMLASSCGNESVAYFLLQVCILYEISKTMLHDLNAQGRILHQLQPVCYLFC